MGLVAAGNALDNVPIGHALVLGVFFDWPSADEQNLQRSTRPLGEMAARLVVVVGEVGGLCKQYKLHVRFQRQSHDGEND